MNLERDITPLSNILKDYRTKFTFVLSYALIKLTDIFSNLCFARVTPSPPHFCFKGFPIRNFRGGVSVSYLKNLNSSFHKTLKT